jgi:hypothetical protein
MDDALGRAIGVVKKAEGKVTVLGAILEAAEAGESDGVVKKMQTYRQMKAVVMTLKESGIVDKLPPGVSDMVEWYLDAFLAMEKHFEAVAKYAQKIEDLIPGMRKGLDAGVDWHNRDRHYINTGRLPGDELKSRGQEGRHGRAPQGVARFAQVPLPPSPQRS